MSLSEKKETNALLALLAHEIFDQAIDIDASTVDWSAVLAEAQCHKVTALMYPAIRSMDGVPEAVFNKVCGTAIAVAAASEAMLKEQRRILDLLEARQIPCAVLKGTSVAYLYPHPELRTIGDIDILVDEENLDEACKALQADGFAPSYTAEKHLCLQKGAVWVEMHRMVSVFPESEKGRFTKQTMADALHHMPILYSCHPRSRKRLEQSGFQLDKRVIQHEPLGFHDYNCLQMNAFCVVSDSGTLPEESSFFTSVGHPFPAVCIRTSTERPEALDKGCFILAGIDEKSLLQAVDTAVEMNQNGDYGIPVPDYVDENVSDKVVKIIQSYTGVVNKMVWRKG